MSQRLRASTLEELNIVGVVTEPKTIPIVKEMESIDKARMMDLLRQYKDVLAWSFDDMKGLDSALFHH